MPFLSHLWRRSFTNCVNPGLSRHNREGAGGYTLIDDPMTISIKKVLESLDESLDLVGCITANSECHLTAICPTRFAWGKIDQRFKELLDSLSLQDLLADE